MKARLLDAPLEKLVDYDDEAQTTALLQAMNGQLVMPTELDVTLALRSVAATLDLPAPTGAAYKVYLRLLGELPLIVLQQSTEAVVREHEYPTFPKPAAWRARVSEEMKAIEDARFTVQIYRNRLKIARLWYGARLRKRQWEPAGLFSEFELPP